MALDTETKRRSMMTIGPLTVYPVPDGVPFDNQNRRHMIAIYSAFDSAIDTFFFWRKRQTDESPGLTQDGDAGGTCQQDADSSQTWVPQREVRDSV